MFRAPRRPHHDIWNIATQMDCTYFIPPSVVTFCEEKVSISGESRVSRRLRGVASDNCAVSRCTRMALASLELYSEPAGAFGWTLCLSACSMMPRFRFERCAIYSFASGWCTMVKSADCDQACTGTVPQSSLSDSAVSAVRLLTPALRMKKHVYHAVHPRTGGDLCHDFDGRGAKVRCSLCAVP